jgi:hypothetical protein
MKTIFTFSLIFLFTGLLIQEGQASNQNILPVNAINKSSLKGLVKTIRLKTIKPKTIQKVPAKEQYGAYESFRTATIITMEGSG